MPTDLLAKYILGRKKPHSPAASSSACQNQEHEIPAAHEPHDLGGEHGNAATTFLFVNLDNDVRDGEPEQLTGLCRQVMNCHWLDNAVIDMISPRYVFFVEEAQHSNVPNVKIRTS